MSLLFPTVSDLLIVVEEAAKALPGGRGCLYITVLANESGDFDFDISERNPRYSSPAKGAPRHARYPHAATLAFFGGNADDMEMVAEGLLAGLHRCKKEMDILEPIREEDKGWGYTPGGYYSEERARPKLTQLGELGVHVPSSAKTRSPRPFYDDDEVYDSPDPADRESNPIWAIARALPALARGAAAAGRGVGKYLASDSGKHLVTSAVSAASDLAKSPKEDKEDKETAERVKNSVQSSAGQRALRRINASRATNPRRPVSAAKHIKTHPHSFFYR
jgi:hypothetical protein